MSSSAAMIFARMIATSNIKMAEAQHATWTVGAIRIISVEKIFFGVQGVIEQLSVAPQTAAVTSAVDGGNTTKVTAVPSEKTSEQIADPSAAPPTVEGDNTGDSSTAAGEQTALPIMAVTHPAADDNTPLTSGGVCSTEAVAPAPLSKELLDELLRPSAFNWADDEDEEPLSKEQADEVLRPSAFNWADEADEKGEVSKQRADELLRPSAFNWDDEVEDEQTDSGYVSPQAASDYSQGSRRNIAEEVVRMAEQGDATDNSDARENASKLLSFTPRWASKWSGSESPEERAHIDGLDIYWEPIIQHGKELMSQGLAPGKIQPNSDLLMDFLLGLGPFSPKLSPAFDVRTAELPGLFSYGPLEPGLSPESDYEGSLDPRWLRIDTLANVAWWIATDAEKERHQRPPFWEVRYGPRPPRRTRGAILNGRVRLSPVPEP
ncbi:hypothetical protein FGG08_002863 [Glutinoglossum americanum]|uniref:Uncharacterized protein n=1 Tax=Glutinoglossum americanum TaxID=1670608 RepID=A0A9P8HZC8_9PEZI|nr:hypothetical protein FGG08_002863 [Glutinoglossum americanum]